MLGTFCRVPTAQDLFEGPKCSTWFLLWQRAELANLLVDHDVVLQFLEIQNGLHIVRPPLDGPPLKASRDVSQRALRVLFSRSRSRF